MKNAKKILSVFLAAFLALGLAACGSAGSSEGAVPASSQADTKAAQLSGQNEETAENAAASREAGQLVANRQDAKNAQGGGASSGSTTLVVYFSRTGEQYGIGVIDKGNTEIVADMIIAETGADRFEIVPAEDYYPYTYDELTDIAKKEQNEKARPAYAGEVPDLSQYSVIYIGAPVWWGDWPMICYTFFEKNAEGLAGKTLIPFSTHAGSGLSGFDNKLASACPDSTIGTGLAVLGADAQNRQDSVRNSVKDWIAGQ